MKIIKRDGRIVDYNSEKIKIAIEKANGDVSEADRVNEKQIEKIIKNIEDLNKKRMLVEDIQDMIETELMKIKKYELAKAYIIYRYNRALVRKSNTTDDSIMALIKNTSTNIDYTNKNVFLASKQRDLIAGEVSKDLTKRVLLPEKVVEAHENGIINFHDADYFLQPMFNTCIINYKNVFKKGFEINNKLYNSPTDFIEAIIMLNQIINLCASNQYGGESINIEYLGEYLKLTEDKLKNKYKNKHKDLDKDLVKELIKEDLNTDLHNGIKLLYDNINTLMITNSQDPFVTVTLYLNDEDKYINYTNLIIEEILNQKLENNTIYPNLVYILNENNINGKYKKTTDLVIKCIKKTNSPNLISGKIMKQNYDGIYTPMGYTHFLDKNKDNNFEGRFNIGVVSLNLVQIALEANKNEDKYFELLDERLDLCYEALLHRYHSLLGTKSNISPIHFMYGAISNYDKDDKIDNLLKNGNATLSLGYCGLYETTLYMKDEGIENPLGYKFALKVMKYMNKKVNEWKKETNIGFNLYGVPKDTTSKRFLKIDNEMYGNINGITDKLMYTNSFHVNKKIDDKERINIEKEFQNLSNGGAITYISNKNIEDLINYIYDNILHIGFKEDNNE